MEQIEEVTTMRDLAAVPQPLGPRIRIAREHAGLTIDEVAAQLGVQPASLAAWETDERAPRANRLLMLAGILNVSLTWLLEGREDEHMEAGSTATLDEIRGQLASARGHFCEAMTLLESAQASLEVLAERDADPS